MPSRLDLPLSFYSQHNRNQDLEFYLLLFIVLGRVSSPSSSTSNLHVFLAGTLMMKMNLPARWQPLSSATPSPTSIVPTYINDAPSLISTYTPSSVCTNSLTMLGAARGFEVWNNEILPGPGLTFTACHPEAVVTSYLDSISGKVSNEFNPLNCPQTYSTVSTSIVDKSITHAVCCPT